MLQGSECLQRLYRMDYSRKRLLEIDFPDTKMGVADRLLLKDAVFSQGQHFLKYGFPLRHNCFVSAVMKEMSRFGYHYNPEVHEFSEIDIMLNSVIQGD